MKNLLKSNITLILAVITIAILVSLLLVHIQILVFWNTSTDKDMAYSLAFWTPLIDSFFVILLLLYIKSFYEKELELKNTILQQAKEITNIGEWELDIVTMQPKWSESVYEIMDIDSNISNLQIEHIKKKIYEEDWEDFESSLNDCIKGKDDHRVIYRIQKEDGSTAWIECRGKLNKEKHTIFGTIQDISIIKNKDEQIDNYLKMIDKNIITSSTDLDGTITHVSKAFCKISGYSKEELIGSSHSVIKHPDMNPKVYLELWNTITNDKTWQGELRNLRKDNTHYWVKATISPTYNNGVKNGYIAIRQDISDKKIIEEISVTDGLTGIFNRRHFNNIFPKMINSAKRNNDTICFLMIDIDNFKLYNDTYGHQKGDKVLQEVANTLSKMLKRADDHCFRIGGEEFSIVFKIDSKEKALSFANRIRSSIEALQIPHKKNNCSEYVTISIGLLFNNGYMISSCDELYKQADDLLYKAKDKGRNQVCSK